MAQKGAEQTAKRGTQRLLAGVLGGPWATAFLMYEVADALAPEDTEALEENIAILSSLQDDMDEAKQNLLAGKITPEAYRKVETSNNVKAKNIEAKMSALKSNIIKRYESEGKDTSELPFVKNDNANETQRLLSKNPAPVNLNPAAAAANDPREPIGTSPRPTPTPAAATQAPSPTPAQTNGMEILNRAMDKEGITDPITRERVTQLAMVESTMNPSAKGPVLRSGMHKGDQAHGLLQIMPKTAEDIGFTRKQIVDPEIAAIAGVRYFKMNLKRFNNNLDAATVAHHSGPGGAKRWLESGSAGTKDLATGLSTDNYLTKVVGSPTLSPQMPSGVMASAVSSVPSRPSSIISNSTLALAEVKEQTARAPVVVNAPQTVNNVQQGGSSGSIQLAAASVVDGEFMKLLVSRTA